MLFLVDKFSFYLYSTPDKVPHFTEIRKRYGLQKNETAFMFAYIDNNPHKTFDEAYEELLYEKGIKVREKKIVEPIVKIKQVDEIENIEEVSEPIIEEIAEEDNTDKKFIKLGINKKFSLFEKIKNLFKKN